MNNRADQENLLAEVLAEASPPDFRAAMLAETLRLARRRRHFHQARRAAGILSVLFLLVIIAVEHPSRLPIISRPSARKITKPGYELVRTQPMPADAVIATRKFSATGFATAIPTVIEVTTAGGGFHMINDNELLSLLADKPAVLIRTGPQSEELVFANPEDQKRFLVH